MTSRDSHDIEEYDREKQMADIIEIQSKIETLRKKLLPGEQYIQVDEGWYPLVIDCDAELSHIDANYQLLQIKEKFGRLRYYFMPSTDTTLEQRDKMYAVVAKYEAIAARTCEVTGKPGILMKSIGGWVRTLNPEYAASTEHYAKYSIVATTEHYVKYWMGEIVNLPKRVDSDAKQPIIDSSPNAEK